MFDLVKAKTFPSSPPLGAGEWYNPRMVTAILALFFVFAQGSKPAIDSNRVTVWDIMSVKGDAKTDRVVIDLDKPGEAAFILKGASANITSHSIVIELKDLAVPALPNKTKYPNAFPRPGVKRVLENTRVIVWDYAWTSGKPTPMHFHDKDVVVVYVANGELKSTTPDGQSVVNPISFGLTRYNTRDRVHTEELVKGAARAIITELK